LILFIAVAALMLAFLRPIAVRHMKVPPRLRTGAAALIGKQAVVLERIANDEGMGSVKIDGEVWTARSYNDDDVIERGTRVDVVDIRGATALVTE
jgi:membrane protein implicated in regulation of membrane protease activity